MHKQRIPSNLDLKSIKLLKEPKQTYQKLVCNLQLKGFMDDHLNFVSYFARYAANQIGIPTSKVIHLPDELKKYHVNKGPFVHAKTKEVFERRTFKRLIQAFDAHPDAINGWVEYVNGNLPFGINLSVTRFEYHPASFMHSFKAPEKPSSPTLADKVHEQVETYLKMFK